MIIGLSGYAQSGKDTVANYLVEKYGFKKVSFADPIREALYRLNPLITDYPGLAGISLAWIVDRSGWEEAKKNSPECRRLLQRFGTEVGREMFGADFWVKQAIGKINREENAVFADVRYRNEAQTIQSDGGQIWRISKPGVLAVNNHESERDLDGYQFDAGLNNIGSIQDLQNGVDAIMKNKNGLVAQLVRATDS